MHVRPFGDVVVRQLRLEFKVLLQGNCALHVMMINAGGQNGICGWMFDKWGIIMTRGAETF
jgi:hypothetical protein